jgi:uncharacterized membrane protein YjfL (UPF0719 family)
MNWLAESNNRFGSGIPLMEIDWWLDLGKPVIITIVIGAFSVLLMMSALLVLDRMTSYSIHKQLEEKQNVAVAIVVGAVAIGVALVVASVARG